MNKLFTTAMLLSAVIFLNQTAAAQVQYPSPSPLAKIHQKVGVTDVKVEYSRPARKGRTLFVDVEKFGKIWRTGANASTKISFSEDVTLEGKPVPAGEYALYSIPGETTWSVMLYKDLTLGGNVEGYDEANEVVRVNVEAQRVDFDVENLTIHIGEITTDGAVIAIVWGDYYVPVKLGVNTDKLVSAQIENYMKNPMASVGNNYAQAASYYYQNGKDLTSALEWIDKAIEINPNAFWNIQTKARILAKMERYTDAIAAAEKSSEVAKAAPNDFGYVEANQKLIDGWSKQQ
jgi:tetratricopeptide (TPR) repeat protein